MRIFVDSSVWIAFFKGSKSRAVEFLSEAIESGQIIYSHPIIIQEVLQGAKTEIEATKLAETLEGLTLLSSEYKPAESAARLYRKLRKIGKTVGTVDVLLASVCIENHLALLTNDSDFEGIPGLKTFGG